MAVTLEGFRTQIPAYAEKIEWPDTDLQPALNLAQLEMGYDSCRWGGEDKYDMLIYYLAAHHAWVMDRQARGDAGRLGSAINKSAGDVSVTYSATNTPSSMNAINSVLGSTSYGQYYMMLKKRWRITANQTVQTVENGYYPDGC